MNEMRFSIALSSLSAAARWLPVLLVALVLGAAVAAPLHGSTGVAASAACAADSAPVNAAVRAFAPDTGASAQALTLSQAYPNPFNPSTIIQYGISKAGNVTLTLYNLLGREVALLVDGFREPGFHTVYLNTNKDVLGLASGVYFYRLETGTGHMIRKLVLVR